MHFSLFDKALRVCPIRPILTSNRRLRALMLFAGPGRFQTSTSRAIFRIAARFRE
jgi:hypothetical protein